MSETRKRVVFFLTPVFYPEIGGIETHLMDLGKVLFQNGGYRCIVATYQPIFTLRKNSYPAREIIGCYEVHRFAWILPGAFDRLAVVNTVLGEIYLAPYFLLRSFLLLWPRRRAVDVIHSQGMMAGIVGRIFSILFCKPLIVSTHAIYHFERSNLANRVSRWGLRGARRVLTLSQQSHDEVVNAGTPPSKVEVYRYWIDEERFHPAGRKESRARLGWPQDRFIALFSGRFVEVKGLRLILNMVGKLPDDTFLVLVGGGPLEAEVDAALKGRSNALLMPPQSNENMYLLYSAADALIVPSLWQEGCGRVILEAMMCGTPVIASRRGGIPEVVTADSGILIEPSEENLLAAIQELKNAPARRRRMGEAARAHAEGAFSSRNAEVILRAYEEAAG